MTIQNIIQSNFASGELDPKVHGRSDLKLFQSGLELCENFIVEPQGPARFRTGSRYVNHTRLNQIARFVPFQFNDEQAYMLEFTNLYMRVFKDEGVVLEDSVAISSSTNATPVVVTTTGAHGYSDGDEVYISGVATATDLNGKYFLVANKTATTFELTDVDGNNIVGTAAGTGGTSSKIFEVATPYLEAELFEFDFDQNADTMVVTHHKHDIREITRTDHDAWTVSTFSRTGTDPFPPNTISTPGIIWTTVTTVTSTAHTFSAGDIITIQEVVGMTEVNGNSYVVAAPVNANNFTINDLNGNVVDSSGYTAWSSGGVAGDYPRAVGYYEGRRVYGGTLSLPETIWGTDGPDPDTGLPRYDGHTVSVTLLADESFSFTIAPSFEGTVNAIQWIAGMTDFLGIGTFGGISKMTGAGDNEPISGADPPNVKPVADVGSEGISPIPRGSNIIYIQRGKKKLRSLEFDALSESFVPVDRNFIADHVSEAGFVQIAFQDGVPDILWGVLADGCLAGLTFKTSEDVSGWHRHTLGGDDVKVISAGAMTLPNSFDQLWLVVERLINGVTRRYVEFFEDEPVIPRRSDYVTGDNNKPADDDTFANVMFEAQRDYVHVDSALSYNGLDAGVDASATLKPGATTGLLVTFTAGAAVFTSDMVGRELWKQPIKGVGAGRATIVSFTDTTHVKCEITKPFDNTNLMGSGDWYLTTDTLSGLDHLEGQTVSIVTDGGEHPTKVVASGAVTLDFQASVIHVGLGYTGRLQTLNLESGGITGPAQTKHRRVAMIKPRFLNTLRARFGSDFYSLQEMVFRSTASLSNRPPMLFTGIPEDGAIFPDTWRGEKKIIVEQRHPMPCVVQFLDVYMETADE